MSSDDVATLFSDTIKFDELYKGDCGYLKTSSGEIPAIIIDTFGADGYKIVEVSYEGSVKFYKGNSAQLSKLFKNKL